MTEQAQTLTEWRCPACGGPTYDMQCSEAVYTEQPMKGRPDLSIKVFAGYTRTTHFRRCDTPNCRLAGKKQHYPTVAIEVED